MFARKPGKGITLEMYIRNTQVNKKNGNIVVSNIKNREIRINALFLVGEMNTKQNFEINKP